MIKGVLIVNNHGSPRLTKFFHPIPNTTSSTSVVFVEALDKCFENVCELDLIFHSDKVHYVLDEIVMGGMVLETNIVSILKAIGEQGKVHKQSMKVSMGGGGVGGGDNIDYRR
ncbi:hypothetical protein TrRE_jg1502 [Triparma retinervis]|uniref:AP complex subunit sigma n=1 Tax=Triparma retinervis TaxID=2557542 RepID=A0A9W7E430_9STRA|nr:hypothetical protein TrRE_jg1502 [Triparma retinervis]